MQGTVEDILKAGAECIDRALDRLLPGADQEPLTTLIREYAACGSSAAGKVQRIALGRVIAKELNRTGLAVASPKRDRVLVQEMLRDRRRPHIYTPEEVQRILEAARRDPAPRAPLRSHTLYMMLVLAYCAGLRLAEIVGLKLGDLDLTADCIEVRDTKFFKSRRLPLSSTAMAALRDYLKARGKAGAPYRVRCAALLRMRRAATAMSRRGRISAV